jgi:hypothetical protein
VLAGSAAGGLFTFGVITATPTVSITTAGTNIGASGRIGIAQTTARTIAFQATSTSGASFPANFLVGTLQLTRPNGSVFCATQADVVGGTLTGASNGFGAGRTTPCPTIEFNSISIDPAIAPSGIYLLTFQARDIAGNLSAVATRTFVIDRVAPTVINAITTTAPLSGGQAETFQATASDDVGLVDQTVLEQFAASTELVLEYQGTTLGNALATPFTRNATVNVQVPFFIRGLALQSNSVPAVGMSNNAFLAPNGIAVGASDPGANWAYGLIGGAAVTSILDQAQPMPAFFGTGGGPNSSELRFQASTASSFTTGGFAATLAPATTGTPTSQTLNLVQVGTPNTPFVNRFARVQLFRRFTLPGSGTPGVNPFNVGFSYRFIADCSGSAVSISTTSSTITNSCPIVPGSGGIPAFPSSGTTAVDLLVVASDANGYAAAYIIPTITLTP